MGGNYLTTVVDVVSFVPIGQGFIDQEHLSILFLHFAMGSRRRSIDPSCGSYSICGSHVSYGKGRSLRPTYLGNMCLMKKHHLQRKPILLEKMPGPLPYLPCASERGR